MEKNEALGGLTLLGMFVSAWIGYVTAWWVGLLMAIAVAGYFGNKMEPSKKKSRLIIAPKQTGNAKQKAAATFDDKKTIMAVPCDIEDRGGFDFEIVGESHYQDEIAWNVPLSHRLSEKFRLYAIAALYQDDDNEHDKNAVAVRLDGDTVGHLSRADAKRFRKWAAKEALSNPATCRAVIVRSNGGYGIWLDLPISNTD